MKDSIAAEITAPEAVSIIGMVFRVRRDLVSLVKERVLASTGLTLEEADVLLDLYGSTELGWPDPPAMATGSKWVTLADLQKSVANESAPLVSRRIAELKQKKYVAQITRVTKAEAKNLGVNAKSKKVCLTPAGVQKGEEIYRKYGVACLQLLNRLSPEKLQDARKARDFYGAVMEARRF